MNILCILGSPRKNGNSETLARTATSDLEQCGHTVEFIRLNPMNISPCQGCGGCNSTGACVIKDDMGALYDKVDQADQLILTTPIYFYNLSGQMKCFIDRFQARWARKYLLKQSVRPGDPRTLHLMATAATHGKKVFEAAILTARCLADTLDMQYGNELLVRGVEGKDALSQQQEYLAAARQFGAELGKTRH